MNFEFIYFILNNRDDVFINIYLGLKKAESVRRVKTPLAVLSVLRQKALAQNFSCLSIKNNCQNDTDKK